MFNSDIMAQVGNVFPELESEKRTAQKLGKNVVDMGEANPRQPSPFPVVETLRMTAVMTTRLLTLLMTAEGLGAFLSLKGPKRWQLRRSHFQNCTICPAGGWALLLEMPSGFMEYYARRLSDKT